MLRLLRRLLITGLLLTLSVAVPAAPPPAGTLISNTAGGSFTDQASGVSVPLRSNTVNTSVAPLEALTLTASQSVPLAAGAPFTVSHLLTNTANATTSYAISVTLPAGAGFTPANLQVVQDLNANGRADPGEPVIAQGGSVTVPAGQPVSLLLTGMIPAAALGGQSAQIVLTATSSLQGATASNTDTLNVTSSTAVLAVALASSTSSTTPGAPLNLTASAVNSGGAAANPVALTVNGAGASLFLLSLQVPANTRFASAQSMSAGALLLYHVLGTAANTYVTAAAAGTSVDEVAWSLPALAPAATLAGQLSVTVNSNAGGSLSAAASTAWASAPLGSVQNTPSNTVVVQLPVRAASIAYFTSPSYVTPSVSGLSGSPLFVQVDAALCNTDPTRVLTAPVTLTSQLTGDVEIFTAVEP